MICSLGGSLSDGRLLVLFRALSFVRFIYSAQLSRIVSNSVDVHIYRTKKSHCVDL